MLITLHTLGAKIAKLTIFHRSRIPNNKAKPQAFMSQINQFITSHSGINASFLSCDGDVLSLQKRW